MCIGMKVDLWKLMWRPVAQEKLSRMFFREPQEVEIPEDDPRMVVRRGKERKVGQESLFVRVRHGSIYAGAGEGPPICAEGQSRLCEELLKVKMEESQARTIPPEAPSASRQPCSERRASRDFWVSFWQVSATPPREWY
jgi:hypothetical protein